MDTVVQTETNEVMRPTRVIKTTREVEPSIRTEHPQRVFEKKKTIFRTYQIVWYILSVFEVLLAFRVALKALGASPFSGFASLIYALSDPLALPFQGVIATSVASQGAVFEWSSIIAAIVYLIIAAGIVQLLQIAKPVTPKEVEENVDLV